jgi:hypothetical protein
MMQAGYTQITGKVARTRIAPGSKSDRVGVVLRVDDGREYVLRRMGGNAFRDSALEALIGSTITAHGVVSGHTFVMNRWRAADYI